MQHGSLRVEIGIFLNTRSISSEPSGIPFKREFELHEFIEYWGTIGILNEEAFESIHAHQNNMVRRFACVRNRNHRDELMQRAFDVMQKTKAKTDAMVAERRRPKRRKTVP